MWRQCHSGRMVCSNTHKATQRTCKVKQKDPQKSKVQSAICKLQRTKTINCNRAFLVRRGCVLFPWILISFVPYQFDWHDEISLILNINAWFTFSLRQHLSINLPCMMWRQWHSGTVVCSNTPKAIQRTCKVKRKDPQKSEVQNAICKQQRTKTINCNKAFLVRRGCILFPWILISFVPYQFDWHDKISLILNINAWFTFLLRQQVTRREQEREGYICFVFHTLDLFSSHLEALEDMSVNQSRVKRNENVSNVLPCYRWFSHESVNVYIRVYFVSFTSRQKSRRVPEMRM